MAFPLLRLPILVIKLVFETMGFIDMFVFTSASLKAKRLVKNLVTIRNHVMRISIDKEEIFFNFQADPNSSFVEQIHSELGERHDSFHLKIGTSGYVQSEFSQATDDFAGLLTYWGRSLNHGAELYNALIELFEMPIKGVQIDLDDVAVETYRNWVTWINESLSAASVIHFTGKCSFSEYIWILKNVKTNHTLSFMVEPTDYPENPDNIEILNIEASTIVIFYGRWISIQHLKSFKSQSIYINRVSLTDLEINTFLRYWRDSEETKKKLSISFGREANPDIVLEGMDAIDEDLMKPNGALNQRSFTMINGEKCTVIYAEYEGDVLEIEFGFEFTVGI